MKSYICVASLALCLLATVQGSPMHEHSEEIKECHDEFNIKKGDIKLFFEEGKEVTQDAKCFLKCVLQHLNVIKDDGTIDAMAMKEEEPELQPYAEECSKIEKNEDLCELAYQHGLCMREKIPKDKMKEYIKEHEENM